MFRYTLRTLRPVVADATLPLLMSPAAAYSMHTLLQVKLSNALVLHAG